MIGICSERHDFFEEKGKRAPETPFPLLCDLDGKVFKAFKSYIFIFPPLFDRFLNNNFIRDRIKRHLLFFYDRVTVILTSQGTVIEKFSSQFSPEEHALFCVNVLRDKSRLYNLSGVIPSSGSTSTQPKVDF